MSVSSGVILKGVAVVGAVVSVTTGGILFKAIFDEKSELSVEERKILGDVGVPKRCLGVRKCYLKGGELKKMLFSNFSGKEGFVDGEDLGVEMFVEKVGEKEKEVFNNRILKFNFRVNGEGELKIKNGAAEEGIKLVGNTNYEFKVNGEGKLEKAWGKIDDVAKKVGFVTPVAVSGTTKSYSLAQLTNGINVDFGDRRIKGVLIGSGDKSKNIQILEEQKGYENGFKFFTPEEINLEKEGNSGLKILKEGDVTYQVKYMVDDWYITKKE